MKTLNQLQKALTSEQGNLEALRLEVRDGWMLYNQEETVELKSALAKSEEKVAAYEAEVQRRLEANWKWEKKLNAALRQN